MFKDYNLSDIQYQTDSLEEESVLTPFSNEIIDFLNAISIKLLSIKNPGSFPELTVLGFWLRKSNMLKIKSDFLKKNKNKTLVPRGLVFQIPPSNVTSISIYSWALSLLAGNKNVIRISKIKSEQVKIISSIINSILNNSDWENISRRNKFFAYQYEDKINEYLSSKCDLRVVWGGDSTVNKFRNFTLKTHATEINFPDKYSICIINIDKFSKLEPKNQLEIIEKFMNDSYWFDQMACSSPRFIFWLSNENKNDKLKNDFWNKLDLLLKKSHKKLSAINSINKKVAADRINIELNDSLIIDYKDRLITRVCTKEMKIKNELMPGGGFFYEFNISNLEEICPFLDRKLQTISYFGISNETWHDFIIAHNPKGIDRIVPIGKALEFDVVWDGIDLISAFSREISIN